MIGKCYLWQGVMDLSIFIPNYYTERPKNGWLLFVLFCFVQLEKSSTAELIRGLTD